MKKAKIIVSKDALCKDYLHFYGERAYQFSTPNIDELIDKGTLFTRHYTAAPSTVMSFYSMATGKYAHETEYEMYEKCHLSVDEETIFTKAKKHGYNSCHIIWDDMWDVLLEYYDYFRDNVAVHTLHGLRSSVGVHKKAEGDVLTDDEMANAALRMVEHTLTEILDTNETPFIWLHLPHVLSGRNCYGSDIDLFDEYVGMVRKHIADEDIVITADHGNMNGLKGKLAYGFDVYDKVASIPLITPRISGIKEYTENTSSVDLYNIIFEGIIPHREFIYCDSAYRAQKSRKLAIVYDKYKYIYNKRTKKEELYDLVYDPQENFSLMDDTLYDVDRKINIAISEEYYYPEWDKITLIRDKLRNEKNRIWKNGSAPVVLKSNIKDMIRPLYEMYLKMKSPHNP